ncbi:MAG TPA: RNA polymerase sigma factor RpoD/SigA [Myxococcota bacterium]|jgi:RNA polymerase primary sigma factor|nr:RNA polymerase sigma factor RpoD/SigA [Myxococcota bacterium]
MTAEEERDAAHRLREARRQVLRVAMETPVATDYVLSVGRRVARGESGAFDVLEDHPGGDEAEAAAALADACRRLFAADRGARLALERLESPRLTDARRAAESAALAGARREATSVLLGLDLKRAHVQEMARRLRDAAAVAARARRDLAAARAAAGDSAARARETDALRRLRSLRDRWRIEPARLERLARAAGAADRRARALRDELLAAHGPLVMKLARTHGGRGLDFEDLLQEGNIGLDVAIERFDPTRGTRLSTLAVHWVRHQIGRAVANKARNVRIPVHVGQQLHRILRLQGQVLAQTGRAPSPIEVAQRLKMPVADVQELMSRTFGSVSLDETLGPDGDAPRVDFLKDPDAVSPESAVERESDEAALARLLETLPARERDVLERRFGLGAGAADGEQTLQQIGDRLKVTRERARQLVARAIAKLRSAARAQGIDLPLPPED